MFRQIFGLALVLALSGAAASAQERWRGGFGGGRPAAGYGRPVARAPEAPRGYYRAAPPRPYGAGGTYPGEPYAEPPAYRSQAYRPPGPAQGYDAPRGPYAGVGAQAMGAGMGNRGFTRGQFLPQTYWGGAVVDPRVYHLRRPPNGYGWVTVGPNAYLTQHSTGLILDTAPLY